MDPGTRIKDRMEGRDKRGRKKRIEETREGQMGAEGRVVKGAILSRSC